MTIGKGDVINLSFGFRDRSGIGSYQIIRRFRRAKTDNGNAGAGL